MSADRNYELKGRGVECRGADFLVKRDTTSTTAAIVVISVFIFIFRSLFPAETRHTNSFRMKPGH